MAVQRYSRHEMCAIISNILQKEVTLLPIGNHELRRHLVYKVKTCDGDFVFKYYYQDVYGGREISTLRLIDNQNIKLVKGSAKILALGQGFDIFKYDFLKLPPESGKGMIISNPPYGERIGGEGMVEFYQQIVKF